VILQYNNERNTFDKIHQETFGKSGCRRIVPGQYLAVDPKGRAVMIGTLILLCFSSLVRHLAHMVDHRRRGEAKAGVYPQPRLCSKAHHLLAA
jgi:hypothetical protein